MSKYIEVKMKADIGAEGVITVNAKTLGEFLKTIEDEQIKMEVDEQANSLRLVSS